MKKALILHSWFSHPENNWYPWLKKELEKKGYEVWLPELPTMPTGNPDMEVMLKFLLEKKFVDKDTVVVGHSLGSVIALRLAERIKFGKGILFAVWDYNDLTPEHQNFWKTMIDHEKIMSNVKEWIYFISSNDPYVGRAIARAAAERVNGLAVDVNDKGHYGEEANVTEVPEILEFV